VARLRHLGMPGAAGESRGAHREVLGWVAARLGASRGGIGWRS
jgi:hypothetical protein